MKRTLLYLLSALLCLTMLPIQAEFVVVAPTESDAPAEGTAPTQAPSNGTMTEPPTATPIPTPPSQPPLPTETAPPTATPRPTPSPSPTPSPTPDPLTVMNEQVDRLFRRYQTVGGSVVVARRGEIVYARDYGYKSLGRRTPVDENTYFRIASVTKLVSGIGLMRLVDEGKLHLDRDIGRYFGYKLRNPHYPDTPITLRQLMSHTAALTSGNSFSVGQRPLESMLSLAANKRAWYVNKEPGTNYAYSNFGAGIAGALMEHASGLSANAYMQRHVFEPLGITAAYAASLIPTPDDLSHQYQDRQLYRSAQSYINNGYEDTASPETHYNTTYGGLWIRSRDLARLGIALCEDGEVDGVRVLSRQSADAMGVPHQGAGSSVTADSPYSLFVERTDKVLPGHVFLGHQGLLNGVICSLYYEPETGFVIAMTTNGCSTARRDRVSLLSIRLAEALYDFTMQ